MKGKFLILIAFFVSLMGCKPILVHQGPAEPGTEVETLQAVEYFIVPTGTTPGVVDQVRAINADLTILTYVKSCFYKISNSVPESYWWRYADGSLIIEAGYTHNALLDIRKPEVRAALVNLWISESDITNGIMVDNVGFQYGSRFVNGWPEDFEPEEFFQNQKKMIWDFDLARPDKHLHFNGYCDYGYEIGRNNNTEMLLHADSISFEGFLYKIASFDYYGPERAYQRILATKGIEHSAIIESLENIEDYQKRLFCYAVYMAVRNEQTTFSFGTSQGLSIFWPEYQVDLGYWKGGFQIINNLIVREYQKGIVVANITDEAIEIDLGREYQSMIFQGGGSADNRGSVTYEPVRLLNVAPESGFILVK